MAHLTESQEIRNSLKVMEKSDVSGYDDNGLALSNRSDSGYYLVSMVKTLKDQFIAYANIPEDYHELKVEFEKRNDKLVPGYFGLPNVMGLAVADDVRDAASIAQQFDADFENNLIELLGGNLTVIPKPDPNAKTHPVADAAERKQEKASNRAPRKHEPRLNAQSALAKVWGENKGVYNVTAADAPTLRTEIESQKPTNNQTFIAAATNALEKYRK